LITPPRTFWFRAAHFVKDRFGLAFGLIFEDFQNQKTKSEFLFLGGKTHFWSFSVIILLKFC
jgi:hypothetical protein